MKSILITIAISVYMTFMVVTIQVANKQTLATSDVTLDIVEVMTRAFDEGGEGGDQEIGGRGTCGYSVWCAWCDNGNGKLLFECDVNKATALHMMSLCDSGLYSPPCNWCCDSCSTTDYCGGDA